MSIYPISGAALGPLLAGLLSPSGWSNVFYMLMFADACALLVSRPIFSPIHLECRSLWLWPNTGGTFSRAFLSYQIWVFPSFLNMHSLKPLLSLVRKNQKQKQDSLWSAVLGGMAQRPGAWSSMALDPARHLSCVCLGRVS